MKLNEAERHVEKRIPEATTAFTIKHSRKAFEILSDKLYTDKPAAIVRELAQNAYDSHVAAGRPEVPIEIDLPVKLDPVLRVRDFGTGMEHEQVLSLYTTYFDSNKSHTNEFVGGLGLGSKSPFSYVDQFTVVSYTAGGEKNTYCAFISTDGTPTITCLERKKYTKRLPGMEISVAIQKDDHRLFAKAAERMLKHFPIFPKVNNSGDFELKPVEYSIKGEFIGIRKDGVYHKYSHQKNYVLMGPVAYEIDRDQLDDDAKKKYDKLFRLPCVFFSEVGKLDIHVSRERLSYDKATKAELLRILDGASVELQILVKEYIAEGATKFDKFVRFYDTYNRSGTWFRRLENHAALKTPPSTGCSTMVITTDRWKYKNPFSNYDWSLGFTYHPNRWNSEIPHLLYIDVKHHVKWIKHNTHALAGNSWVLLRGTEEDCKAFEKRFNTTALKLSSLDEPPTATRSSTSSGVSSLFAYRPVNGYDIVTGVTIPTKELKEPAIGGKYAAWVAMESGHPRFSSGKYNVHKARTLLETLGSVRILEDKVILGIPIAFTKMQRDINLPAFADFLDNEVCKWEDLQSTTALSTMYFFSKSDREGIQFIRSIFRAGWMNEYIQAHPKSALTQLYHYSCYELNRNYAQYTRISDSLSDIFREKVQGDKAKAAFQRKMLKLNKLIDRVKTKHPFLVTLYTSGYNIENQSSLNHWDIAKHYFELAERKR